MNDYPAWRHGPDGQSAIFDSEADVPKGWVDHPSKVKGAAAPAEGTHTAVAPSNGTTSAAKAAKTTTAKSQTTTPPEISALTDPVGNSVGNAPDSGATTLPPGSPPSDETNKNANPSTVELDADGHVFDPELHAATKSRTKANLWRMKVGVTRPAAKAAAPAKPPLDL